jgi:hypothetical protein
MFSVASELGRGMQKVKKFVSSRENKEEKIVLNKLKS